MAEVSNCVFCSDSGAHVKFKQQTLEKCRVILKQRKEHNLKYKDVVLPDTFEGGYHRQCYKYFTGLSRKYYLPKCTNLEKVESDEPEPLNLQDVKQDGSSFDIDISDECYSRTPLIPESRIKSELNDEQELVESDPLLQENNVKKENIPSTSAISISESDTNIALDSTFCIFCDQKNKKRKSKILPLFSTDKTNFWSKINQEDEIYADLVNKVSNYPGFKVYYHTPCRLKFSYQVSRSNKKAIKRHWHNIREHHQAVHEEFCAFIQEEIVQKGRSFFLTYLHRYYVQLLYQNGEVNPETNDSFTPHHLELKIKKTFDKVIKFLVVHNKKLVTAKDMTAIDEEYYEKIKDEDVLHKAALVLRKSVLKVDKGALHQNVQDSMGGETVPQELMEFYSTLIAGSVRKNKQDPEFIRQVKSYCEEVMCLVRNKV